ncbi:MAG: hypothetical protein CSA62_05470 [Planctomycetota bacterium]|nr:MAG: hypothetical protein CSA62_05470 [Planctomycetota bacterium]
MRFLLPTLLFFATTLPAQDPMPGPASLRSAKFDEYGCVPLALVHRVGESLPKEVVKGDYVVVRERKGLRIDSNGDGEVDVRVTGKKPKVVQVGYEDTKPWLLWFADDDWWIAPGRAWTARLDQVTVTILDGDLDGRPDGDEDWIRFGEGSFFRHHVLRLVPWNEHMAYYRFEQRDGRTWLKLRKDARTPGVSDEQWQALLAFNRVRMRAGLAPTRLEPSRAREMQSLAQQALLSSYAFDRPWTPFPDRVNKVFERPVLRPVADPLQAIAQLQQCMVSRLYWLGTASKGFGFGCASKEGLAVSTILLGGPEVRRYPEILVSPAPGQVEVPRVAIGEQPYVEEDPQFWKKTRGVPILVHFGRVDLRRIKFTVWQDKRRKKPLTGQTFTPDRPVSSALPENLQTAFFVPDKRLDRHRRYWVECKFRLDYQDGRLLWCFETNR